MEDLSSIVCNTANFVMNFKTSDGVNLFYRLDGDGPPLIMLSGIWSDTNTWNAQVRSFAEHYTCIRLDHRGIGQSEKWAGEHSYELHARDVKELLDHLGLKSAAILGVCHGGMAAVTLAKNYPGCADALCINATQLLGSERLKQMYFGWKRILKTSDFETLYTVIMPTIMSDNWLSQNRERLPALLAAIEERIEFSAAQKMVDALVAYSATGFTTEEIASIEVPALIMASGEDRFIPPQVIQTESQYWPNATYHLFENSGHFPQREMPETYNSVVLGFLQSLAAPRTLA
jgi:pimeloyl-ACP methyl ester carboxylesterase